MSITVTETISTIAAIYAKALRSGVETRAMQSLPDNSEKAGIMSTILMWFDESVKEVAPGSLVLAVSGGGGSAIQNPGMAGGFTPMPMGGGPLSNNAARGNLAQHALGGQTQGGEILPPDCLRTIDPALLGVVYRVSTTLPEPAGGSKCGVRTTKKGKQYTGKYYCDKRAGSINNKLNIRTCSQHKNKETTGDDDAKSQTKASPVTNAAQFYGVNNGHPTPQGFNPNAQQVQQIGGAMQQQPGFQSPIQPAHQPNPFGQQNPTQIGFQPGGQAQQVPNQASNMDMSNSLLNNVQPQLQNMQATHQLNPQMVQQQFQTGGQQPASQAVQQPTQNQQPAFGLNQQQQAPARDLGAFGAMPAAGTPQPTLNLAQTGTTTPAAFGLSPAQQPVAVSQPFQGASPFQPLPVKTTVIQEQASSDDENGEEESADRSEESEHDDPLAVQRAMMAAQQAAPIANPSAPVAQTQNPVLKQALDNAQGSPFGTPSPVQTPAPAATGVNPQMSAMMQASFTPK
tara:strand:+ start:15675 stop:17210 length:1536 start_codon:yes stop_codon:yes gene_type:complete